MPILQFSIRTAVWEYQNQQWIGTKKQKPKMTNLSVLSLHWVRVIVIKAVLLISNLAPHKSSGPKCVVFKYIFFSFDSLTNCSSKKTKSKEN